MSAQVPVIVNPPTRREAGWLLRRCARRGHVLAFIDDQALQPSTGPLPGQPGSTPILRCLRCGTWASTDDAAVAEVLGTADEGSAVSDLPLLVRGPHGRRFGLLRLLALERGARGLLMIVAGIAAFHVAEDRGSLLSWIERLAVAARPLGEQLGIHVTDSWLFQEIEKYLAGSGDPVRLAGVALIIYGVLQGIEGIGLWNGLRWAEYLAAVVTSAFIPLEIYELVDRPTLLKALALVVNVFVVIYLVYKGRLFGVRGGHAKYLAEVRDSTLLADVLRSLGRAPAELTSTQIV